MQRFGINGWRVEDMPDVSGRRYAITGGNSGIGFEAARVLAGAGAEVIILCRSPEKADKAVAQIKAEAPQADIRAIGLDLADLSSVAQAASLLTKETDSIDGLLLNAGIMMPPKREVTQDGFEMQIGVNHLGHFALAGQLFPLVEKAQGRIVSVASIAHKYGRKRINFKDLQSEKSYNPVLAYSQSKLANLLFTHAVSRRLKKADSAVVAAACHPGYSATNLQFTGPGKLWKPAFGLMNIIFAQSAKYGAYPTLLAATDPKARSGGYYGPTGFQDMGGPVRETEPETFARDNKAADQLWQVSEELTRFSW
ncbi:oxidoreductase [Parvularcula sp. IMCC14364]|uniref:oxidoreductase n=1 Tax=Parvularcula sp. IMCC14364 TaxID=3067902 RepID=UPI002742003B|nr:oxidoreductase [Parvularcula sp. IMCC14364]